MALRHGPPCGPVVAHTADTGRVTLWRVARIDDHGGYVFPVLQQLDWYGSGLPDVARVNDLPTLPNLRVRSKPVTCWSVFVSSDETRTGPHRDSRSIVRRIRARATSRFPHVGRQPGSGCTPDFETVRPTWTMVSGEPPAAHKVPLSSARSAACECDSETGSRTWRDFRWPNDECLGRGSFASAGSARQVDDRSARIAGPLVVTGP